MAASSAPRWYGVLREMSAILRMFGLWRRRWALLALGLLIAVASFGSGIALLGRSGGTVAAALLGLPLLGLVALRWLAVARVVLRYLERLVTHDATFRALADLRVWFFRGLARGSAGGLGMARSGDVLSRLVRDVDALDGLYLRILVPWLCAVIALPVVIAVAWPTGAGWAVAACGLIAVLALPVLAARSAWDGGARLATAQAGLRVAALDALSGLREVRAFAAEGRMLAAVQAQEAGVLGAGRHLARQAAAYGATAGALGSLALLAVLALAAGRPPVAIVTGAFVVVALFEAAANLPRAGALAGHAAAAARRVLEAAEAPPRVAEPSKPAPSPSAASLRFEAVRFAWAPGRPVLDGLTMDIPAGAHVALLGPSGAGKSTLAALALKVAAPEAGRVLLGGMDIAMLRAADVRARIAWLGQASHLFADTIRNNLLLARPDGDDAALWAALEAAQLAEKLRALPDGLDTWLGEGGAGLSGGEGRRLALARALLSPAPILLLDEPCAGLDAETERGFLTTLNEAARDRTTLLIVHRLTGVERLDRIYRLSAGRAVAAAG